MINIMVISNLRELKKVECEYPVFFITPIQFEDDPVTGFYLKCPFCNKVSEFQFSKIYSKKIDCLVSNCNLLLEIDEIHDKINIERGIL